MAADRDGDAPTGDSAGRSTRVGRLRSVARAMDSAARIPGTDIRFGLDALIGLVPGVGDVAGGVASGWILLEAARLGASRSVLARMLGNVVVEVVVGAAPFLGDLFDVAWKANARNVDLLERHLGVTTPAERSSSKAGPLFVASLMGVLMLAVLGVVAAGYLLIRALTG